jgi:tetratricopeptide (TPR) repeat protein
LHDCPPLASLHRADLRPADRAEWESQYSAGIQAELGGAQENALPRYVAAAEIDDHFAELHYRLARCQGAIGRTVDAREHYAAACDWDAMQFRTDRRLNAIVREVTEKREAAGLFFVDAAQALSDCPLSEGGSPGARLFYEHVHLRFDGDYWIAKTLLPRIVLALGLGASATPEPSRDECAAALAYNEWDELDMLTAVAEATARPPFLDQLDHAAQQERFEQENRERLNRFGNDSILRTLKVCRDAVQQAPDDWQLRYILGRALYSFKAYAEAVDPLQNAVRLMPFFTPLRLLLVDTLAKTGRPNEAAHQLQEALRFDPQSDAARTALEQVSTHELQSTKR